MVGYGDHQLGATEEEEGGMVEDPKRSEYEQMMLQMAMEDFEKNFQEMWVRQTFPTIILVDIKLRITDDGERWRGGEELEGVAGDGGEEDSETSGEEEEQDLIEVDETRKDERCDCESYLRWFTNTYSHTWSFR